MDFVRSYFGTNEPLTRWTLFSSLFVQISADQQGRLRRFQILCSIFPFQCWSSTDQHWSGQKVKKKVFIWSEVHLYLSNFLQNPYISKIGKSSLLTFVNIWVPGQLFLSIFIHQPCEWHIFTFKWQTLSVRGFLAAPACTSHTIFHTHTGAGVQNCYWFSPIRTHIFARNCTQGRNHGIF